MTPFHEKAREFAEAGVPVFPCWPNSKKPLTDHGFHDATTDVAVIDAWWTEHPEANIAFCPQQAGLAVIDIDGAEGEAVWEGLELANGPAPATYTVRTPRGGRHLYFSGEVRQSQGTDTLGLGPHLDTRGIGSYALIPPSVVGGKPYELVDEQPPRPLPEWVTAILGKGRDKVKLESEAELDLPGNVQRAAKRLQDLVKSGNIAIEGSMGNFKTYTTACEIMELGLSKDKALELMLEHWNDHCLPPWEPDQLEVVVFNASQYAQNDQGVWAAAPTEEVFGDVLSKLAAESASQPARRSRFQPLSLEELDALPPPTWLIADMIPDKAVTMFYGPGGSFKSFLVLQYALELAKQGIRVAYGAGEGARGMGPRAKAWKLLHEIAEPLPICIVPALPWASDGSSCVEFADAIKAFQPQVIVIDTVARMMTGQNENDAKDVGVFVGVLEELKRAFDCALILVHHSGKESERGARGSSALPAAVDAAFEVKRHDKSLNVEVWCRRMKDAEESQQPWTYEGRQLAGSLVFQPTTPEQHRKATHVDDALGSKAVGKALAALGARGEDKAVTSLVLASAMLPEDATGTPEARQQDIERMASALRRAGKEKLAGYCMTVGRELMWNIP